MTLCANCAQEIIGKPKLLEDVQVCEECYEDATCIDRGDLCDAIR